MTERAEQFARLLLDDPELQQKMSECKSTDEVYSIACSYVEGLEKDEFVDLLSMLEDELDQELNTDDLIRVAGGEVWEEDDGNGGTKPSEDHHWVAITISASASPLVSGAVAALAAGI